MGAVRAGLDLIAVVYVICQLIERLRGIGDLQMGRTCNAVRDIRA
jgi:hypothetical protein